MEAQARSLVEQMEAAAWDPATAVSLHDDPGVQAVLAFAAEEVVPRLARTGDELGAVLHALDGGFVPAGPSGSPLRGLVNVLPTGRNFYAVDPRPVRRGRLADRPGDGRLAGAALPRGDGLLSRPGRAVVWGTSAMRTSGDDVAEVLALLGVRPVWDETSRRVTRSTSCPSKSSAAHAST